MPRFAHHHLPSLLARLLGRGTAGLAEDSVAAAYFAVTPPPLRPALIVGASPVADPLATAAFEQLALRLAASCPGLAFHWLGPLDPGSAARLQAAEVGLFDPQGHLERAQRLSAAWVFVALGAGGRFPLGLAEAMASGLPCVAMDSPGHRSLVHPGETGYLCRSPGEVMERIAQLADAPALRERMGRAGRARALQRCGQAGFRKTLVAAYAALPQNAVSAVATSRP